MLAHSQQRFKTFLTISVSKAPFDSGSSCSLQYAIAVEYAIYSSCCLLVVSFTSPPKYNTVVVPYQQFFYFKSWAVHKHTLQHMSYVMLTTIADILHIVLYSGWVHKHAVIFYVLIFYESPLIIKCVRVSFGSCKYNLLWVF